MQKGKFLDGEAVQEEESIPQEEAVQKEAGPQAAFDRLDESRKGFERLGLGEYYDRAVKERIDADKGPFIERLEGTVQFVQEEDFKKQVASLLVIQAKFKREGLENEFQNNVEDQFKEEVTVENLTEASKTTNEIYSRGLLLALQAKFKREGTENELQNIEVQFKDKELTVENLTEASKTMNEIYSRRLITKLVEPLRQYPALYDEIFEKLATVEEGKIKETFAVLTRNLPELERMYQDWVHTDRLSRNEFNDRINEVAVGDRSILDKDVRTEINIDLNKYFVDKTIRENWGKRVGERR